MTRPATPDDLPALLAVQSSALNRPLPDLLRAAVAGPLSLPVLVSTTRAGSPVGYALAVPGENAACLVELAVAPGRRGEGRGSALLEAACGRLATECGEVRLTVRAGDDRARRFYARNGFREADRLPGYYDGEDGLVLVRPLTP